ncbi:PREDICTED: protein bcn92 [Rhagoletis zephyria]|uniref:protein bcn92 n=1 Tax=Rhagoletis zephyria TaxID=28612 RepID=UPI0008115B53|nr:PREDICTED: protein bcn92 [Rhagoletis zephyria]
MATRRQVIAIYRQLLREAEKIPAYNFRLFAGRKVRDTFRENKGISDFAVIDEKLAEARQSLELIRRQAIIGHLYSTEKLVIEQPKKALRRSK